MTLGSKTVFSPAKEPIEIVDDDDWLEMTNSSEKGLRQWAARRPILAAVWNHGTYSESSGLASSLHFNDARRFGYTGQNMTSFNSLLRENTMTPAIERKIIGRRTYEIQLVALPRTWYEKLEAEWPHNGSTAKAPPKETVEEADETEADETPVEAPAPETVDIEPAPPTINATTVETDIELAAWSDQLLTEPTPVETEAESLPPMELQIANTVASALLTQVVEIISTGAPHGTSKRIEVLEADLHDMQTRYADRLAENNRMRQSIRDLGEEVIAVRQERDGLRKRLRAVEINLEKVTSADVNRVVNERVQVELAKIMQATPSARHKDDNNNDR